MTQQFRDIAKIAMSGCVHEFHYVGLHMIDRGTIISCIKCNAQATAGEVAWMLGGAHIVREYQASQARAVRLANLEIDGEPN